MQENESKQQKTSATESEEKRQSKLKRRKKLKYGGLATAVTVIFVAVVVLINVVVEQIGNRFPDFVLDLTTSNVYEISDETLDYIKNLDQDVEIAISAEESNFDGDTYNRMITETLERYQGYSDHISVTYFDTTKDPDILAKYQELYSGDISSNEIIVRSGNRIKVYPISDLFEIDQDMYQYYYYGYVDYADIITAFKGEQVLTTAIMNVTDSNPKSVGLIMTSNGDYIFSATKANYYAITGVQTLLDDNGYDVTTLDLINDTLDPAEYDILLLPAPANDLTTDSVKKLTDFLYNDGDLGKQLIYIADYTQSSTPNLDSFLKEWNVQVDASSVFDEGSNTQTVRVVAGNVNAPVTSVTTEADYNGNLANASLPIVAPLARPITELTSNNGRTVTNLLTTSETSYLFPYMEARENADDEAAIPDADTDATIDSTQATMEAATEAATTTTFDASSAERGSNAVMVLCRDQQSTGSEFIESDVIVLGSMSMLDYLLIQDSSYNNAEYFIGLLNSVCGKEDSIVIATKDLSQNSISTSDTQLKAIRTIVVIIIPLVVVVIGVVVAVRRRYR